MLQKKNLLQIPRLVRWQYELEASEVLKVGISGLNLGWDWELFYAKMGKDGCIFIPKLTLSLLQGKRPSLAGSIFEVTLEPA
jgi:hypothetical protein